jgi:hypothetical protein
MSTHEPPSAGLGVVVLAAYRPDPELFGIQLRSIRDQTRYDFRCLIGADGGEADVRQLVDEFVGEDERFTVVGWEDNVGFYLNFERLLMAVPESAAWVALSDQDDAWYPTKLEHLVPRLDKVILVTGQARVTSHPSGQVLLHRTSRRVVPAGDLLLENQVSGALAVFRRELLDLALPFPRHHTVTQLHDHWLAVCAAALDRYVVVEEVVQDYVQHADNIVGEVGTSRPPWTLPLVWRRMMALADEYEGGHSPVRVVRACQTLSFGWRRVMLEEIVKRLGEVPEPMEAEWRALRKGAPLAKRLAFPLRGTSRGNVAASVRATFVAGMPGEIVAGRAARAGR